MDEYKKLKKTYPQKFWLKLLCRILYYLGCGDCWYEAKFRSRLEKTSYVIWVIVSNTFVFVGILNEFLAYSLKDLVPKEKNDLMQHTFAHPTVYCKVLMLSFQRNRIKIVFKRFLEDTRIIFSSPDIDRAAFKKAVRYTLALLIITYSTLLFTELDALKSHNQEGIPIRTEVTYYPNRSHSGVVANIARFFAEFHWWYLVTLMILADGLSISSLIFLEAKFKLLQLYFENLRKIFTENSGEKSQKELEEIYLRKFVFGVKLHEESLWCAKNVQYALGNIYSLQIFESLTLLVVCLIKLVINERTVMFLFANLSYIACIILLNGAYMMAAGDITHEASMLSTSIFHSGWELLPSRAKLRTLAVVAMLRSQAPVYMTAFGIIKLSYVNFIWVLRSSYSFFAVMY